VDQDEMATLMVAATFPPWLVAAINLAIAASIVTIGWL